MSSKVKTERRAAYKAAKSGVPVPQVKKEEPKPEEKPRPETPRPVMEMPQPKKLFVHIKDPDDRDALMALKQTCSNYPGNSDIVLVLGEGKKSAIKLPFTVDSSNALIGDLVKLLGEDCVVLK